MHVRFGTAPLITAHLTPVCLSVSHVRGLFLWGGESRITRHVDCLSSHECAVNHFPLSDNYSGWQPACSLACLEVVIDGNTESEKCLHIS
ncbi:hypothetical protein F4808DRAFT_441801 [Astrocystis sublimbata]|nr:hypothetical protein F4808DRAFT_441800 [Astrocystis sublimbata]KAI0193910.1 hypothetical protein F4808DRAFT_441801 [Astrocystis sublimbata]